uniref:Uncharacterized protein n=1 Tax=Romanomermis culicivorax TaxID=13658 RepID=A0A915LD32_ROMCU
MDLRSLEIIASINSVVDEILSVEHGRITQMSVMTAAQQSPSEFAKKTREKWFSGNLILNNKI